MSAPEFASFGQNGEDVVLWRALRGVVEGRYIDIGANHPRHDSVTKAFYDMGWSGITVEPDPEFALLQADERPRDLLFQVAVDQKDHGSTTLHVVDGTGLSTLQAGYAQEHAGAGYATHDVEVATRTMDSILAEAGWEGSDIHFMSVDTEGSEADVLAGMDLSAWRPWVMVIEATRPNSTRSTAEGWEQRVLDAGYEFCLFDGLSRFYVAAEKADLLRSALSYPACILDNYTRREYREAMEQVAAVPLLVDQVSRWRTQAVSRWAKAIASQAELDRTSAVADELRQHHAVLLHERERLRTGMEELQRSSSWQVTRPLRWAGGLARRARGARSA